MSSGKIVLTAVALFAAAVATAELVVYDDLHETIVTTSESTCLLDVSGHAGVTLCEVPSAPAAYDLRSYFEVPSPLTEIYFAVGFILFCK